MTEFPREGMIADAFSTRTLAAPVARDVLSHLFALNRSREARARLSFVKGVTCASTTFAFAVPGAKEPIVAIRTICVLTFTEGTGINLIHEFNIQLTLCQFGSELSTILTSTLTNLSSFFSFIAFTLTTNASSS